MTRPLRLALLAGTVLAVWPAHAGAVPFAHVTRDVPTGWRAHSAPRARSAALQYALGPVLHATRTHLIFWQPGGSGLSFEPGYGPVIETFFAGVAADSRRQTNVLALTGQYSDGGGPAAYSSVYAGAVLDTQPLPAPPACAEPPPPPADSGPGWNACVTAAQIEDEISRVVAADHLPSGPTDVYFMITPSGLGDCQDSGPDGCALGGQNHGGYCGYHGITGSTSIPYAVIPYNAVSGHCQWDNPRPNSSSADPAISTIAHEYAEVTTDPASGIGWSDSQGSEIGDLCVGYYGPALGGSIGLSTYDQVIDGGRYYIQDLWSNADGRCMPAPLPDRVSFSVPRRVPGDRSLSLRAGGGAAHGSIVHYSWLFGDGHGASGRRTAHAFLRSGVETVVLRSTDSWGNWAFASHRIEVVPPPPPVTRITGAPSQRGAPPRVRFRFATDAAVASFQCRLDRGAWTACSPPLTTRALASGGHRFSVRARDTFGQVTRAPASYAFSVA